MRKLGRRGQIAIPAMLLFPTFFLFIFLIYETAKLSRQKISHQFAMDAAAFVEMTNYSDFLNRTAYVNGAFPFRIFEEGYIDFNVDCKNTCPYHTYDEILFNNAVFPRGPDKTEYKSNAAWANRGSWKIEYGGGPTGDNKNTGNPPTLPVVLNLISEDNAKNYYISYEMAAELYKLYVQVYTLLGSVEDSQLKVLQKLSGPGTHSFLVKSYWLNATGDGTAQVDAKSLASSFDAAMGGGFDSINVAPACQQKLKFCGNRYLGATGLQTYREECTDPIVDLQPATPPCSNGLFQLMWVNPTIVSKLNGGLSLWMTWPIPPKNYWNVDFPSLMSQSNLSGNLHTTISLMGDPANHPAVWPDPTPRFQVRSLP